MYIQCKYNQQPGKLVMHKPIQTQANPVQKYAQADVI